VILNRGAAPLVEKAESRKPWLGGKRLDATAHPELVVARDLRWSERPTEDSEAQQLPLPIEESLLARG
jgi:hypothetical protein